MPPHPAPSADGEPASPASGLPAVPHRRRPSADTAARTAARLRTLEDILRLPDDPPFLKALLAEVALPRATSPARRRRLTDLAVRQAPPGRHGDGNGLHLVVAPSGSRRWIQRIVVRGRRRDFGHGGYPAVSLAEARRKALAYLRLARRGRDPLARAPARADAPTVREVLEQVIEARRPSWKDPDAAAVRFRRAFEIHGGGLVGDMPVDQVATEDVTRVLRPLWGRRNAAGERLFRRLDLVFRWAEGHGLCRRNPARSARELLPPLRASGLHFPAVPHHGVRDALALLRAAGGAADAPPSRRLAALALELIVLTAARSGEAFDAVWPEFDEAAAVWTVPAPRMKAGREHRVPLSRQVLELLPRIRATAAPGDRVFAYVGRGSLRGLPRASCLRLMQRLGLPGTVHGFRSSFRDWASEVAGAPFEVAEMALAHSTSDATVAAYARSTLFERRRALMQAWADYVLPPEPAPRRERPPERPGRRPRIPHSVPREAAAGDRRGDGARRPGTGTAPEAVRETPAAAAPRPDGKRPSP